jgi:hypothetical protein
VGAIRVVAAAVIITVVVAKFILGIGKNSSHFK